MISEYGRLFAKTGRLDRRFHRLLDRSFAARLNADYDVEFDLGDDEVREFIREGRAFVDAARTYLQREGSG